jgi:uncharacterized protein YjbI with pentapeptide repeats
VAGAAPSPSPGPQLQDQKLREEIRKLRIENDQALSPYSRLLGTASFLGAVVAVGTLFFNWRQQRGESARQRDADRAQREAESLRRFDESLQRTVQQLGDPAPSLRAGAAATLQLYLEPRYAEFRELVVLLAASNLRLPQDPAVQKMLVRALARAIRLVALDAGSTVTELDLSAVEAPGLDLRDVDLGRFAVTFDDAALPSARLGGAHLWKLTARRATLAGCSAVRANLGQARLEGADLGHGRFDGARLTSAQLRDCDLRYATFRGSSLQSAHLEGADLRGARFEGANLADTYLTGARLEPGVVASIRRAENWRRAHLDEAVLRELVAAVP